MEYFVGDYHFGHENIMKYCHRPFSSTKEMDAALIDNTNKIVGKQDVLYFQGDWSFRNVESYRKALTCRNIHFILGNHDREPIRTYINIFTTVKDLNNIKVIYQGQKLEIVLCHYAMRVWNKSHHGAWHLYGHSHNTLPDDPRALAIDVGVDATAQRLAGVNVIGTVDSDFCDCCGHLLRKPSIILDKAHLLRPEDYRPLSLDEVGELMAKKSYSPPDYHGDKWKKDDN